MNRFQPFERLTGTRTEVDEAALSPDGRYLVMVDTNPNVLCVYDTLKRSQIRQVPLPPGRAWGGAICRTAWSAEGLLALVDPYGELFIMDPLTQDDPVFQARFEPAPEADFTDHTDRTGETDGTSRTDRADFTGGTSHTDRTDRTDGTGATGVLDQEDRVWGGALAALCWSPDGRYLAAFTLGRLGAFDLASGVITYAQTPQALEAEALSWSPNLKHLACGDSSGTVWVQTPPISGTWDRYEPEDTCEAAPTWSPSGELLVAAGPATTVRIIDAKKKRSKTITIPPPELKGPEHKGPEPKGPEPKGSKLRRQKLEERDEPMVVASPAFISENVLAIGLNEPPSVAQDPDRDLGSVCLVDVDSGEVLSVFLTFAIQGVRLLRAAADTLVCVDWWGMCSVVPLGDPAEIEEWFTQDFAYASAALARWNPDSKRIAFADYSNIIVLNNETGKLLRLNREATSLQAAGWDADGRRFATEDDYGRIQVYEVGEDWIRPIIGKVARRDFTLTAKERRNAPTLSHFHDLFDQYVISPNTRLLLALGFDTLRVLNASARFVGYQLDLFPSLEDSDEGDTQYCVWNAQTWEVVEESDAAHRFMKKISR